MSVEIGIPSRVHLRILSPEQLLYEGQVLWVQVPLEDGLIGIWPGHAPLIGSLGRGGVQWDTGQGAEEFEVEGGMLRVDANGCVLLVGRASASTHGPRAAQTETLFGGC